MNVAVVMPPDTR